MLDRVVLDGSEVITSAEHTTAVATLLSVPSLLGICVLYGSGPGSEVFDRDLSSIAAALLELKPSLMEELARASEVIAENMLDVVEACSAAVSEALHAPSTQTASLHLVSVIDGMLYLRDSALTLCALFRMLPKASQALLRFGPGLIESLSAVHDTLVPRLTSMKSMGNSERDMKQLSGTINTDADDVPSEKKLQRLSFHLELASEKAIELLLFHAFLDRNLVCDYFGEDSNMEGSSSMRKTSQDASNRGEGLVHCLTLLGYREGPDSGRTEATSMSLPGALTHRYGLPGRIYAAMLNEVISLDEAQIEYVCALLGISDLAASSVPLPSWLEPQEGSHQVDTTPLIQPKGMGDIVTEDVERLSLVSQVKDLLPDLGEGFIAACLDVFENSPELTINALLEGSLPKEIASLDRGMTMESYQNQKWQAVASHLAQSSGHRGTGASLEAIPSSMDGTGTRGSGDRNDLSRLSNAPQHLQNMSRYTAPSVKRRGADTLTAKFLDAKDSSFRQNLVLSAVDLQWEYEDEYDDSFDELMLVGPDGMAEAEEALNSTSYTDKDTQPDSHGRNAADPRNEKHVGKKASKKWVLDGRIYNYPKSGAKELVQDASRTVQPGIESSDVDKTLEAKSPEGEGPLSAVGTSKETERKESRRHSQQKQTHGHDANRERRWKDKHKSSVANHRRKDRAAQKLSRGMN